MPTKRKFPQSASRKVFGHPLRVALYARVSTHDQQTLPLQIRAMRPTAPPLAVIAHLGKAFNDSRYVSLAFVALPLASIFTEDFWVGQPETIDALFHVTDKKTIGFRAFAREGGYMEG